jgi:phage major head subunit gpT-like protein
MSTATKPNNDRAYLDEMNTRAAPVSESTINEQERTVNATLTTDQPVAVYDWRLRAVIDEVLTTDGAVFPRQLSMFEDHWMSSTNKLGSVRGITKHDGRHDGTLHFARNAGQWRDEAWEMVRQKHNTDVSIGYSYGNDDYVDIQPGQRAVVEGKEYKADKRVLRVVKKWRARELSVVHTGADDMAKIRSAGGNQNSEVNTGNSSASHLSSTTDQSHSPVDAHNNSTRSNMSAATEPENKTASTTTDATNSSTNGSSNRAASERERASTPATQPTKPNDSDTRDLMKAERERLRFLEEYRGRGGVDDEVLDKMIDEGVSIVEARAELNALIVDHIQKSQPVSSNHALVGGEGQRSIQTLQAALLLRLGFEPDHAMFRSQVGARILGDRSCGADWLVSGCRSLGDDGKGKLGEDVDRAFSKAYARRHVSLLNLCRGILELHGERVSSLSDDEIVGRAVTTSQLQTIFTTAFNASFLEGFTGAPDTTSWVKRIDLPNFQSADRIQMGKYARLTRRVRGNVADQGTIDAKAEQLRVFEYASKFVIDEQDIVDDRFGALEQMTPQEMGQAAADLAPDLVYGTLLSNPTLGSDSTALFHSNHGNLASSKPLNTDNLAEAASLMDSQVLANTTNRLIGVVARTLLVSPTLRAAARALVRSEEIRDTTTSTKYGTANPNRDAFDVISEGRLRVGVEHPLTGATIAGEPNNWMLIDQQGRYGLELAYLSGRGRVPRVRRLQNLNDGYAMGWNIDHVLGCGAVGYEGIFKRVAS